MKENPFETATMRRPYKTRPPEPGVVVGLDLGKQKDPTAISVVEIVPRQSGEEKVRSYDDGSVDMEPVFEDVFAVRDFGTLPLGTAYPDVGRYVAEAIETIGQRNRKPWLVIDASGVGVAVTDIIRGYVGDRSWVSAATFVSGDSYKGGYGSPFITVGKMWMLGRLQALFQTGRIRLPQGEEWVEPLVRELMEYEVRQTESGTAVAGAFGSKHDDRVVALGLSTLEDLSGRRVRFGRSPWR
jgi:hypothetical protein